MCIVVNAQENPSFDNEIINETPGLNETQNQTGVVPSGLIGFQLAGIEPKEANPGDVVVTINVVNTGTVALNNLMPVVVGRGFSAYNIVPIALLNPNQTAPAYIEGKFREKGEILLAIKISDKVFYEKVSIKAEPYFVNETKLKEMEEARQDELIDLSAKLDDLKAKYISLETDLQNKEGDYDVSRVKLDELKGYLRTSESSLLSGDAEKTKINIALANKETLVTAGSIVMEEVRKNNVNLMPIDSEHSAIFQCLNGENINDVDKIIITCSGGAFKNLTKWQLENVTAKDALKHPTWNMGNKITIDSATLMNKGFEVIEAHWLYNMPYEKIEVLMHPQSIIHSLVEFKDNSVLAQLGNPDMKIPIQYALSYSKRFSSNSKKLNLAEIKNLSFSEPNFELFPCLKYACDAGIKGGTLPAVLNAANEIAVYAFLEDKIKFLDIPKLISKMMQEHKIIKNPSLNEILDVDKEVKEEIKKLIEK